MSLSAGEVEEYRRTFNEFDKDGDGRITKEELKKVLAVVNPDISDINVDSIISAVDNNNDGCLDFNEFLNLVKPPVSLDDQKKEILSAFRVFDVNGDGFISKQELMQVMGQMGDHLTHEEAEQMIKEVDVNNDGHIDYEEFVVLMLKQK